MKLNQACWTLSNNCKKKIASKQNVPAYVVFSDAAIGKKRPHIPDGFLVVSGVGKAKLDKYGREFIDIIVGFDGEKWQLTF